MAAESGQLKWEGKASVKLLKTTAEAVWPLLEDFCTIHKWLPTIDTCYRLEGVEGRPGLIRYCSATLPPSSSGSGEAVVKWCHEKLLEIDLINKSLSYEVLENNMGFKSYKSTVKVHPIDGGDYVHGCMIEWSFLADPAEGLSCDDLVTYLKFSLQGMARNMENALEST